MTNFGMNFERALMTATAIIAVALTLFAARPLSIPTPQEALPDVARGVSSELAFERVAFRDEHGVVTDLAATNGNVRLVTTFYAHCPGVCPGTVESLRRIEGMLSSDEKRNLKVIMLSLDPEHDSKQALADFRSARHLDPQRWITGAPSVADLPALARGLRATYKAQPDGSIDHTSPVVLLSTDGRIRAQWLETGEPDARFVNDLRSALAAR